MRPADPRDRARLAAAQLHDAALAARQVADAREAAAGHRAAAAPAMTATAEPRDHTTRQIPRPGKDRLPMHTPQPPHPQHALTPPN